ncbi:MAG: ParB/RepB/Spo0J family partition protein [Nocardiopsaceae bacterium]|nr:ParB/RepB/Spo0J family partition protein [Nocardiopsaceae bacterium]
MAQQRRGLGKGLGALIPEGQRQGGTGSPSALPSDQASPPDSSAKVPGPVRHDSFTPASVISAEASDLPEPALRQIAGAYFEEVAVDSIAPNPRQPRRSFDEEALDELAASITEVGLLQPVVVRSLRDGKYELIMGERRWRASMRAGLDAIPAIVRETPDTDMLRDALLENLHRQQLDPLEEAAAYQQLLDDFGATHEQLAKKIGRSRPHITNTLRLLNLPPVVQKRVAAGIISAGHARALLTLDDAQEQERLAQQIVAEGLSVRAVEERVMVRSDKPAKPSRKSSSSKPVAPALRTLSGKLSDIFDTRVKVDLGRSKGKIVIDFYSTGDLERIVKMMAPEAAEAAGAEDTGSAETAEQDSTTD